MCIRDSDTREEEKYMLRSLLSAFAMYSRIPVPQVEWKEENRRYSLGFFPLIGAVTGALLYLWYIICSEVGMGNMIFAAGAVILPLAVNGGIHFDGFCDVTDALSSFGDKEKKLAILSDPHIGSFAVMWAGVYLLAEYALFAKAYIFGVRDILSIAAIYVLSRSVSGISAMTCKSAKSEGTLYSFVKPAHRNITIGMDVFFLLCAAAFSVYIHPVKGIVCTVCAAAAFIVCVRKAKKEFGGITGDVLGWALQMCEILCLAAAMLYDHIVR